jgi:ParB family chromosome partitioning protein
MAKKQKSSSPANGAGAAHVRDAIARAERVTSLEPTTARPESALIELSKIVDPEHPMRETMSDEGMADLMASMAEIGLLQPVLLVPRGPLYEVVVGHRRVYSARALHWARIPAVIFPEKGIALEAARVHENYCREDVNPAEEAIYLRQLVDRYGLDEAGLCALVRRSPAWISDRWLLLQGDELVFAALRAGQIGFAVARELNRFSDRDFRRMYLDSAVRNGATAALVSRWRKDWEAQGAPTCPEVKASPTAEIEHQQATEPHRVECFMCGGHLDPWNLEVVHIHKHERAEIMRALAAQAKGA